MKISRITIWPSLRPEKFIDLGDALRTWIEVETESSSITAKMVTEARGPSQLFSCLVDGWIVVKTTEFLFDIFWQEGFCLTSLLDFFSVSSAKKSWAKRNRSSWATSYACPSSWVVLPESQLLSVHLWVRYCIMEQVMSELSSDISENIRKSKRSGEILDRLQSWVYLFIMYLTMVGLQRFVHQKLIVFWMFPQRRYLFEEVTVLLGTLGEQWKKPWLVGLYKGLYYPVM